MCKILVNAQKCNYAEIVRKKSHFEGSWWTEKPANSHSLVIFSTTVCLREVILARWISKWVSASAYERCPLTGGYKCRVLVVKLPGP